ncbi:hypothetical protein Mapa_013446 [Marchantia paleacea]|nr:hypothetical protein Mapa_013446 [Marchantia paleacea]
MASTEHIGENLQKIPKHRSHECDPGGLTRGIHSSYTGTARNSKIYELVHFTILTLLAPQEIRIVYPAHTELKFLGY